MGISLPLAKEDSIPNIVIITLAVAAVASLLSAYYIPRRMYRDHERKSTHKQLLASLTRGSFCMAVAIYGLVLGAMETGWYVTLPFFATAASALTFTFPTEARWKRMLGQTGQ